MTDFWLPRLLGLLVGLTAGVAQAAPGTRCDGAQAGKLLGVSRDWQVACWRLDDGREVIAAVPLAPLGPASEGAFRPLNKDRKTKAKPETAAPLEVRLALARDATVLWRGDMKPDGKGSADLRELLEKSEEWLVGIEDQQLGKDRGVRIGVVGHWGREAMWVRELALLFRLPGEGIPMRLVWSGLGNTRESRLDYCLIEGIASFQQVDDKTLERQMRLTPTVNRETKVPRAKARDLEKKCVATSPDPQRFPLTP